METENKNNVVTIIDDGLFTTITAKITTIERGFFGSKSFIGTNIEKETLFNLLKYKKDNPFYYHTAIFCPILLQESDEKIESLGQFNPYKHKEAIEAFRRNRAIYYSMGQGALIYNAKKQPDVELSAHTKSLIEELQKNHINNIVIPEKQSHY